MTEEKKFTTRDLTMASTLITLKFFMVNIDYQHEGERPFPVAYFNFKDTPELHDTINKYRQGQLGVEPRTFANNVRELKAEITNHRQKPSA